jgi:hypothetical protein
MIGDSVTLTPHQSHFGERIEARRAFMRDYRDTFRALAKSPRQ